MWAWAPWLVSPAQAQEEEEPGRRIGPGGQELSAAEALRLERFETATRELRRIEPGNPELMSLSAPGSVPDEVWVSRLEAELAWARARAAEKVLPGRRDAPAPGPVGGAEVDLPGLARRAALPPGPTRSVMEALFPEGKPIGVRVKGAGAEIRTVTPEEFGRLRSFLLAQAQGTFTRPGYKGTWYRISQDMAFGLRSSDDHGDTIDFDSPYLDDGYKVHRK